MAYIHLIDSKLRLAAVRLTGCVSGEELLRAHMELARSPDWSPGFSRVWDARELEELLLEQDIVPRFLKLVQELGERAAAGRVAYLTKRSLEDAVAGMFAALSQRGPSKVHRLFRHPQAAAEWLEVPPDDLLEILDDLRARSKT